MSKESSQWLNQNVLVGMTSKRGNAWHYKENEQGSEPNHYIGAIPIDDVRRRLFHWSAVEAPVYVYAGGNYHNQEDRKAVVRDDTFETLGVFKDGYSIHQYSEWLLDTVSNIIDDSNLQIGSAGLLKNGGVAWVSIEMEENLTAEGFEFRPHLLATTSHNGTLATTFKRVCTAVVCDNTLAAGLGEQGQEHKTRHSKHSGFKLQNVRDALGIVHSFADDFTAEIQRLCAISVTDSEWDAIVNRIIPVASEGDSRPQAISRAQNKQEAIRHLYKYDDRSAPWAGTALGALQAFNTYNHHLTGKDESRVERNAFNALTGKTSEFDRFVLNVINEVVYA
jgi:phage/plasmid-like protein (TIGR03299 family)